MENTDVSSYFNDVFLPKKHYKTYEELEHNLKKFQVLSGTVLRIKNSSSVEYENKRKNIQIPVCIKYFTVTYSCVHYGNYRSKGKGVRPNRGYLACGCEFLISAKYSDKLNGLFISKKNLIHNHKLNVKTAHLYARNRCLNSQQLQEVSDILRMNPSNKELQAFLHNKFGKAVTLRDCVNLKARVKASPNQAIDISRFQDSRVMVTSEQTEDNTRALNSRLYASLGQVIDVITSQNSRVNISPDNAAEDVTWSQSIGVKMSPDHAAEDTSRFQQYCMETPADQEIEDNTRFQNIKVKMSPDYGAEDTTRFQQYNVETFQDQEIEDTTRFQNNRVKFSPDHAAQDITRFQNSRAKMSPDRAIEEVTRFRQYSIETSLNQKIKDITRFQSITVKMPPDRATEDVTRFQKFNMKAPDQAVEDGTRSLNCIVKVSTDEDKTRFLYCREQASPDHAIEDSTRSLNYSVKVSPDQPGEDDSKSLNSREQASSDQAVEDVTRPLNCSVKISQGQEIEDITRSMNNRVKPSPDQVIDDVPKSLNSRVNEFLGEANEDVILEFTDVSNYFNDIFQAKTHYKTYEELEQDLKKFQAMSGTVLRIKNSSSVEYESRRRNLPVPVCIKYFSVTYSCVRYGEHHSKSRGIRPNRRYLACGCEFIISAKYSDKLNGLFITKKNLIHNHKLNVKTAHLYVKNRCLNAQQLQEVGDILLTYPSNKELQAFLRKKFGKSLTLRDCVNLKAKVKASLGQAINIRSQNDKVLVTSGQAIKDDRSLNSRVNVLPGQAIDDDDSSMSSKVKASPDQAVENITKSLNSEMESQQIDLPLAEMVIVNHKVCVSDVTAKQSNIQRNSYLMARNLTDRLNLIMTSSKLATLQKRMKFVAALIEAWERDAEVSIVVRNDGNAAVVRQSSQHHQEPIEFDAASESIIAEPHEPSQCSCDNALPDAYFPLVMLTEETEACSCDDVDGNDLAISRSKLQENEKVKKRYTHMEVLRSLNPKLRTIKRHGRPRKKRSLSRFTKWHASHKKEREEY
ncbi:uncharacterized protein [Procambarus clarkii]|uniref:uncharacterized protein isoform X1 n=2 Tax=Procambarus clarkii TaxID=6728 RepID=UPI003743F78E